MTDRQYAERLAIALRECLEVIECQSVTVIEEETLITKSHSALAAWDRHNRSTEQQLPLRGI